MPVIFRAHGLRFVIFVDDHPPPHVHVRGRGEAKIGIADPCPVLANKGLSRADMIKAGNVVRERQDDLLNAWNDLHGQSD